jgi:hypothetical protein
MFDMLDSPEPGDALAHVRLFLATLGIDMIQAARTLGGPDAEARALRLLEQVRDGTPSPRLIVRELDWLWSLLSLENVHDLDSVEAACFASLDPASEEVAALCALTDELAALFDRIGAPRCPFA